MIAKEINSGAIVVIPTDTVYAIACKLTNKAGINKICRITLFFDFMFMSE